MKFTWKDYKPDTMGFVEGWLDDSAVSLTGMDDGWQAFHEYWTTDGGLVSGSDYWCKVVFEDDVPFAVIAFSLDEDNVHIMEILVKSNLRGKGYGSALLRELLTESNDVFSRSADSASAVIYPNNVASKKAFENAGFVFDRAHEDGDALYYVFHREQNG